MRAIKELLATKPHIIYLDTIAFHLVEKEQQPYSSTQLIAYWRV